MTHPANQYRERIQPTLDAWAPKGEKQIEGHMVLSDLSLRTVNVIADLVKPKKMIEIGFNAGHSALAWMETLPNLTVHSIDICRHGYTQPCAKEIEKVYGKRFKFGKIDSHQINPRSFAGYDFAFIDGGHEREDIQNDWMICANSEIEWILIDDYDLNKEIRSLVQHIIASEDHSYVFAGIFRYESMAIDEVGTTDCVLLRRTT